MPEKLRHRAVSTTDHPDLRDRQGTEGREATGTLRQYFGAALRTLPPPSRRRLALAVVLLAAVSILDFLALVLVFGIASLGTRIDEESGLDDLPFLPAWAGDALRAAGVESVAAAVSVLGLVVVAMFVAKSIVASAVLRRVLRFLARQEAELTHRLMASLMRAPLTFHLKRRYIDVMTDVTVGAESLLMKAIAPAVLIATEIILILMLMAGLLALAPLVAVGSAVYFAITLALLNQWIGRRASAAGAVDVETTRGGMVLIQWALGGYREIATRGVTEHFVERVNDMRQRGAASRAEVAYLGLLPRYFLESALVLGMAFAFAVQVPVTGFAGALSGLALFAVAGFRLLPSLQRLQSSSAVVRSGRPFGERTLTLMAELDAVSSDGAGPVPVAPAGDSTKLDRSIAVQGVTFVYPEAETAALSEVSFTIPARQMTAIVGASGSGKSTMIDVLLGLLRPTQGDVLIDDVPLRDVRSRWLCMVGYVPQSVFLMPTTIRENVALGVTARDVDDEQVWEALRRASLDQVVAQLPGALDYVLGDAGAGISGGQRQRLGIARALYHRPQVLILDEATSALDVGTEAEITQTLARLEGLTKVVVAHRLSTVREAAQVVLFEAGRIGATGTFDQVARAVPDFARQVELSGLAEVEL